MRHYPDLPPDWALPMQEIVLHAACDCNGHSAISTSAVNKKNFDASNWKISITLNPKVDADIQPGAGLTRKEPFKAASTTIFYMGYRFWKRRYTDMRRTKGPVASTSRLIPRNSSRIRDCPAIAIRPSYHSLTKYLGIADWLYRSWGGIQFDCPHA